MLGIGSLGFRVHSELGMYSLVNYFGRLLDGYTLSISDTHIHTRFNYSFLGWDF